VAVSIYQTMHGPLRYVASFVFLGSGVMCAATYRRMAKKTPLTGDSDSLPAAYVIIAKRISSNRVLFTVITGVALVSIPLASHTESASSLFVGLALYVMSIYAATWLEPPRKMHLRRKVREAAQRLTRALQPPVPAPVPS